MYNISEESYFLSLCVCVCVYVPGRYGLDRLKNSLQPTLCDCRRQVCSIKRADYYNYNVYMFVCLKARRSDASRPGKTATEEALHKQLTAAPPVTHLLTYSSIHFILL